MPIIVERTEETESLLSLVNMVLLNCGLPEVNTLEGESVRDNVKMCVNSINFTEQEAWDEAGIQHSHATWLTDLDVLDGDVAPDGLYTPDSTFRELRGAPWIDGVGSLLPTTRKALMAAHTDMRETGTPMYYYDDNGKLGIFPIPDDVFLLNRYAYQGSYIYACSKGHVADGSEVSRDNPDVNQTTWAQTTVSPIGNAEGTYTALTDFAWTDERLYYSARMVIPVYSGLILMTGDDDTTSLPNHFITAIVAGGTYRMLKALRRPANDIALARADYYKLLGDRKPGSKFGLGNVPVTDSHPL